MNENETNNQQDRELTDLIAGEVDAILRELAEGAAKAQPEPEAIPAETVEPPPVEENLADTADFPAVTEEAPERELTEEEYERRLASRDPRRRTIRKTRYCLPYNGHIFEIDIYPFWTKQAVMEIELKSESEAFDLPPQIHILREVTEDLSYSNHSLAREIPPEDE